MPYLRGILASLIVSLDNIPKLILKINMFYMIILYMNSFKTTLALNSMLSGFSYKNKFSLKVLSKFFQFLHMETPVVMQH